MSTSGSYSFTLNKNQIISRALQMINVSDINETVNSDDFAFASDLLNMMIEQWEVEGIHLWKRRQATLFTQLSQNSYQLGSVTNADHCTNSYVLTTVTANVAANVTSVTVASTTGMSIGMSIGLELDNNTRQWGTISNISGLVITLSFSTTNTSAATNTVVAYSALINKPIEILRTTTLDLKNGNNEVTMMDLGYDEYFNLPVKTTLGRPVNWYYDRVLNNSLPYTGTLYLFPQPSNVYQIVNFTYCDSIQDLLNNGDNVDFPRGWLLPICSNLAVLLAAWGYGKFQELPQLQQLALSYKGILDNYDADEGSISILPNSFNGLNNNR